MMSADDRLKALFAEDEPAARDPAFSAAVIERMARRRWLQDMGMLAGVSAVGGVALWGFWPLIHPALGALSGELAPAAVALVVALSALGALRALPGQAAHA
jgi:hypothetical protein